MPVERDATGGVEKKQVITSFSSLKEKKKNFKNLEVGDVIITNVDMMEVCEPFVAKVEYVDELIAYLRRADGLKTTHGAANHAWIIAMLHIHKNAWYVANAKVKCEKCGKEGKLGGTHDSKMLCVSCFADVPICSECKHPGINSTVSIKVALAAPKEYANKLIKVKEKRVCLPCLSNNYVICNDCGDAIKRDNVVKEEKAYNYKDTFLCYKCYLKYTFECAMCTAPSLKDGAALLKGGSPVCRDCFGKVRPVIQPCKAKPAKIASIIKHITNAPRV